MVLTNAFVGALQALSAIQRLSGHQTSTFESVFWNAHSNQLYSVGSDGMLDRLPDVDKLRSTMAESTDVKFDRNRRGEPVIVEQTQTKEMKT